MILEKLLKDVKVNENEKLILQYVLEHIEEISKYTSRQLAKCTYTNPTTILRLCKKLGYENFNDFKVHIAMHVKNMNVDIHMPTSKDVLLAQNYVGKLTNEMTRSIQSMLNIDTMKQVFEVIQEKKNIIIFASGFNRVAGDYARHLFMLSKKNCMVYEDYTDQLLITSMMNEDSVVILLSKTGKTNNMIKLAKMLRNKNIETVAITSKSKNALCDYSTYNLYINLHETDYMMEINYIHDCMFIFNVLYTMFKVEDDHSLLDYLQKVY